MNWIRRTVIFVSLLIMGVFVYQAKDIPVQEIKAQKTDTNFSKHYTDSSDFIRPQTNYHFVAKIKTNHSEIIKWFDSLLMAIPQHQTAKSASNFKNQFSSQSRKLLVMLYPFHFFW